MDTSYQKELPEQQYQRRSDLSSLVRHIAQTNCQDRRDIWYGIQGLIDPRYRTAINYHQSVEDVFLDAALAIFMVSSGSKFMQDILSLASGMEVLSDKRDKWKDWSPGNDSAVNQAVRDNLRVSEVMEAIASRSTEGLQWSVIVRKHFRDLISDTRLPDHPFLRLYRRIVNEPYIDFHSKIRWPELHLNKDEEHSEKPLRVVGENGTTELIYVR